MTDSATENLVLEHLRSMRSDLSALRHGQELSNERLSAIEHHMAGFHVTETSHSAEIDSIKARIERIEKRLGLVDST